MVAADLIKRLPQAKPLQRLEGFMAMEAVIDYMLNAPGTVITLRVGDAPRVQAASKMRGISLPLLAIRVAIENLSRL